MTRRRHGPGAFVSLCVWIFSAGFAAAQAGPTPADSTAYPASYFAAFTPQTALDSVERTPGAVFLLFLFDIPRIRGCIDMGRS